MPMHSYMHAETQPDAVAVHMVGSGQEMTYLELEQLSCQAAHLYQSHGLKEGDVVAVFLENRIEYFALAIAATRIGLYFTAISSRLSVEEVDYIVENSGAQVLITSPYLAEIASKLATPKTLKAKYSFSRTNEPGFAGASSSSPGPADSGRAGGGGGGGGGSAGGSSAAGQSTSNPQSEIRNPQSSPIPGYLPLEPALAKQSTEKPPNQIQGNIMLYSSGTTGRPKGVKRPLTHEPIEADPPGRALLVLLYKFRPGVKYLSPAPLYHAAPLAFTLSVLVFGGTVYCMEHFDAEQALAAIDKYKVTHSQWVPTMFIRMLKLPAEVREKYDVSSLQVAIHAAAPCPVPVKQQMMDWWGPVIYEYYAGSEGNGYCAISPQEWLAHPGSVGKCLLGILHIVDEETGEECPPGQPGLVYFEAGPEFEYHGDPEKTKNSMNEKGWTTLGDIGYVNDKGYLFLTDRKAFMIITGGVNVYPQEVENVLVMHPKVMDAAVFGIPHEEFGEEVKAVIQPKHWEDADSPEASEKLANELNSYCREHLSHIKCPRSFDFMKELPRHPTGKLYKKQLRDKYWEAASS